ncbi:DNA cytosine methyltransferase [Methylobacillus caricis]|uniref:DNA cytosine methyltransferase n=1 Tax=Methylobacillus caricis TaxID=1971611 RepID=UPI001CFFD0C4|nr:DNA cytosine methyltransferase [Methylobacillus caricis]MCB5187400.1 DNA cytosine methyltransferase [Methylobacillus caricis]
MSDIHEIRHFHFACGSGGGKKGLNKSSARVGNMMATSRCIGGIDVNPGAIRNFDNAGPGRKGTVMDLFTRQQYIAFHGREPGDQWREVTPADIQAAAGHEHPHIVLISSPCKGLSGLLSETLSKTGKYQALNELTLRCVWLMCEAWKDDPVELIVFENVPRIATRGRHLLDQIEQILHHYGYAVAETTHDCGELGGLAQSRKRFLLVARHMEKVPNYLYEPPKRPLRAVGDVLGRMLLPGDLRAGPMHRIPSLQWKTWVRLAFVEAGSDWRSLNKLAVEDGLLRDYLIVPDYHAGYMGVNKWADSTGTITGHASPSTGKFSVADPRYNGKEYMQYGVIPFDQSMGAISSQSKPGGGKYTVADPRMPEKANRQNGMYRVVSFDRQAGAVTGAAHVAGAAMSVADPRGGDDPSKLHGKYPVTSWKEPTRTVIAGAVNGACAVADPRSNTGFGGKGKYRINGWDEPAGTVIAGSTTGQGAFAVADPRTNLDREKGDHYLTGGHYGVIPWDQHTGAVSASGKFDNGRWSVADPRIPAADEKLIAIIQSLDGTWHRPFTTLELAALQSYIDPEEKLVLDGLSDQEWREQIGNMIPPDSMEAIGNEYFLTLLLAWSGETFQLSASKVWVQPVAVALSVAQGSL